MGKNVSPLNRWQDKYVNQNVKFYCSAVGCDTYHQNSEFISLIHCYKCFEQFEIKKKICDETKNQEDS